MNLTKFQLHMSGLVCVVHIVSAFLFMMHCVSGFLRLQSAILLNLLLFKLHQSLVIRLYTWSYVYGYQSVAIAESLVHSSCRSTSAHRDFADV